MKRGRVVVPPEEEMDDETFCKHINLRHAGKDPLFQIPTNQHTPNQPDVMRLLRVAHRRSHLAERIDHAHA